MWGEGKGHIPSWLTACERGRVSVVSVGMRGGGVLSGVLAALAMSGVVLAHKCERISIPMCQELGYNLTVMPNFVGHEDQLQAERGVTYLTYPTSL